MQTALVVLAAYLIGSVSFADRGSRLFGLPDPRSYGSGNPGATNVLRTGSKLAAVLTLLGDGGKGWLAVFAAALCTGETRSAGSIAARRARRRSSATCIPVFHRFQGGKGVATAAGVLLGFDWRLGLGTLATWVVIARVLPLFLARGAGRGAVRAVLRVLALRPAARAAASSRSWRCCSSGATRRTSGACSPARRAASARRLARRRKIPARAHRERVPGARRARPRRRSAAASAIIAPLSVQSSGSRIEHVEAAARAPRASSAARSRRLAPTPPATTSRVEAGALQRRARTSRPARRRSRPRRRARGRRGPARRVCAPRTSVSTAVFSPLKLKSRSPLASIGRGSLKRPGVPRSASRESAGPPG